MNITEEMEVYSKITDNQSIKIVPNKSKMKVIWKNIYYEWYIYTERTFINVFYRKLLRSLKMYPYKFIIFLLKIINREISWQKVLLE